MLHLCIVISQELIRPCNGGTHSVNLKQRVSEDLYLFQLTGMSTVKEKTVHSFATSTSVLINVMDGSSDALTIEIYGLYPVLKISNFLNSSVQSVSGGEPLIGLLHKSGNRGR